MNNTTISILLLVIGFALFTLMNSLLFSGARLDLTEHKLYTLSDGTLEVIDEIDEPLNLYFFFSDKASEDLTSLRAYAQRVEEMLEEYALRSDGKINLKVVDPEPFSDDEDRAAEFGLQGVPITQAGDELFFGLAGTNALDGQEVIPFFQPDREEFLEYELTKLIYSLSVSTQPKVGVYSGLEIDGSVNPQNFQATEPWVFLSQLRELHDVEVLDDLSVEGLAEIDLLLVIHPKELGDLQKLAIDQHVMSGRKLILFMDPLAEMDRPATPGMPMPNVGGSNLNELTIAWGVTMRTEEILGDSEAALMVQGANGAPVRHLGIIGFTTEGISRTDVVTSPLESINMATVGILDVDEIEGLTAEPLLTSSEFAGPLQALQFQFLTDPAELQKGFTPTGEKYSVAVRLTGRAMSAFPEGVADYTGELIPETNDLQVVVVADSDVLSDRLWVQVQDFFGQQIASAFADNGSFVTNLVENLSGSSSLIKVRSRGQFTRPFTVVQELQRVAEDRYLQSAEDLQAQLTETEQRLTELQNSQVSDGLFTLTAEQEAALEQFQDEKLRIRKELRDVRHQLDKDIEDLGTLLKFMNILLLPLLLTGALIAARVLGLGRRSGASS